MSAFICSDKHFATVARGIYPGEAIQQAFADALKRQNVRAVTVNRRENTPSFKVDLSAADNSPAYSDRALIRLLDCIDYQSCEHDDYDRSLVDNAASRLVLRDRPGFEPSDLWSI